MLVVEPAATPTEIDVHDDAGNESVGDTAPGSGASIDGEAIPWTPTFDESDDLDGLLSARSPLLARAFRGDDRPRPD